MAGSLIKIDEEIVTSAVASVTLGGSNWDSSYDVYMVQITNFAPVNDDVSAYMRITKSGTADSTSNYDSAFKLFKANTTFTNNSDTNEDKINFGNVGTGTSEGVNATLLLFNFNNTSEYSFATVESTILNSSQQLNGKQGGFTHTVESASDGLFFYMASGNIASGRFSLFGLAK